MQILMKNKRKQVIYLIILFGALGGSAFIWFGASSGPEPVPESVINAAFGGVGFGGAVSDTPSGLLPFGTDFETDLFSQPKFLELRPTGELIVNPEELGLGNPFSSNNVPLEGI